MGRGATTRGATFTTMPLLAEVVLPPAMPSALAHLKGGAFEPVDGVGSRSLGQQPKHDTVGALRSGQMHCRGEGGERKGEAGGNVGETILAMPRSPEHDAVKIASAAEKCAPVRVQRGGGEGCMPIPLINGV